MSHSYVETGYWLAGYAVGDLDYDGNATRVIDIERNRTVALASRSSSLAIATRIREINITR